MLFSEKCNTYEYKALLTLTTHKMKINSLHNLLLLAVIVTEVITVSGHTKEGRCGEGHCGVGGGLIVREERGRYKREVGPHIEKKYRRLEHSIMVQADIRSRYVW